MYLMAAADAAAIFFFWHPAATVDNIDHRPPGRGSNKQVSRAANRADHRGFSGDFDLLAQASDVSNPLGQGAALNGMVLSGAR
jgi:hypothetical protein